MTVAQEVPGWDKYLVIKHLCSTGIVGMEYKILVALLTTTNGSSNDNVIESLRWQIEESTACKTMLVIFDCLMVLACAEVWVRFEESNNAADSVDTGA